MTAVLASRMVSAMAMMPDPVEMSRLLVDKVEELGLQPFEAPDPLPPIDEEQIKLVCWMVIAPTGADDPESSDGLLSQTLIS